MSDLYHGWAKSVVTASRATPQERFEPCAINRARLFDEDGKFTGLVVDVEGAPAEYKARVRAPQQRRCCSNAGCHCSEQWMVAIYRAVWTSVQYGETEDNELQYHFDRYEWM